MTSSLRAVFCAAITTMMLITLLPAQAQTLSAQDSLNQYISDLRKNPNDNELREKIIRHVQMMSPAPSIPEQAREHFVMATTFQKEAKDNKGYELAIKEYKAALVIAPWWPEAYSNLGIVQKLAGQYDDSIQTLTLYLLTKPTDARNAQDEIYKIKAVKRMSEQELVEKEKKQAIVDFSGVWEPQPAVTCWQYRFSANGNRLIITTFCPGQSEPEDLYGWVTLNGRDFQGEVSTATNRMGGRWWGGIIRGVISEDNRSIKWTVPHGDGPFEDVLFKK